MNLIQKKLFHIIYSPKESIEDVKKILLQWILIAVTVVSLPLVVIGTYEAVTFGNNFAVFSYIIFYLLISVSTFFQKKINHNYRASLLIATVYFLGVVNIIVYGFSGAGIPLFLVACVFSTLFFSHIGGLISIGATLIPMAIIGWMFTQNILSLEQPINQINSTSISWITASATLLIIGLILILCYSIVYEKMKVSLKSSKKKSANIIKTNNKLTKLKTQLEIMVEERTKELEATIEELKVTNEQLNKSNLDLSNFNKLFIGRELRIKKLKDQVRELEKKVETQKE